jgi:hypothetical protein
MHLTKLSEGFRPSPPGDMAQISLENRSGGQTNPMDPMATYDFRWLWRELGVEAMQR